MLACLVATIAAACTTVGSTPAPIDVPTDGTVTTVTAVPAPDTTTDTVAGTGSDGFESSDDAPTPATEASPAPSTTPSDGPEPILIAPAAANSVTVTATPTGPFFLGPGDVSQLVNFTGNAGQHSITWTVTLGPSTVGSGSGPTYSFDFDLPGAEEERLYAVTATPSNNGWAPGTVQILLTHASS